jgi:FAD synthetase
LTRVKEIAQKYISNLEEALKTMRKRRMDIDKGLPVKNVLDSVNRYVKDSKYFLEKGDDTAALASASYSEGLLDALKLLNIIEISWKKRPISDG